MFKTIRKEAGRIIGWSGTSFKEKYYKRREKDVKRAPAPPMEKPKLLELEGLDVVKVNYYTVKIPAGFYKAGYYDARISQCEGIDSLKTKISELTGEGYTELIVTAYQRVEEYKVSTKITTKAEPFTSA